MILYSNSFNVYNEAIYPGTELVRTVFKVRRRMKSLPSCSHVLHKTLNLAVSRCCFTEDGEEISARAEPLFCSVLSPIVL